MASTEQSPPASRALPQTEAFWARLAPRDRPSRWRYPRVHANLPVRISLGASKPITLRTNDLSVLGLQVRCDRRTAARLRPDPASAGKAVYDLEVRLEIEGAERLLAARGRLVHITLLSDAAPEQEVAIGFQLQDFAGGGAQDLERFVAQHLRPAP